MATGIRPPVHTGIAHRRVLGIGQIDGGVTHPPAVAFTAGLAALEAQAEALPA